MILLFFFFCTVFCMGTVGLVYAMEQRQASASGARLLRQVARVHEASALTETDAASKSLLMRAGSGLRQNVSIFQKPQFQQRLLRAGYASTVAQDYYSLIRIAAPAFGFLLGVCIPVARGLSMFFLPLLFFYLPEFVLSRLIRNRAKRIAKSMPDVIDLMVICVEAGLGLDQSTLRVADELAFTHPDISDEFVRMSQEQRAGKPRMDAWRDMSERLQLDDIDAFVAMIVQAERFGTPIVRALSTFAANTRLQRTQKVEEKAAKTTIKITFPLVLFIFPCIFIVLLGPAFLNMARHIGDVFK